MMQNLLAIFTSFIISGYNGFPHPSPHPSPTPCPIDLLINGQDNPVGIVNLDDLKPGDRRWVKKDIYLKPCSGKVYLHLKDLTSGQGLQTEPEMEEENGTPKSDLQNYIDYDLKVGNKVIIGNSRHIPFPDIFSCWIPLGEVKKEKHVTVKQSFHFDKQVTNWAQGDEVGFTEEFIAINGSDEVPDTGSGRIWDKHKKKCVPKPTPKPSHSPRPTPTDHDDDDE